MRSSAYQRQILNQFVLSSETSFIDDEEIEACTDYDAHPLIIEPSLSVFAAVDASVRSTMAPRSPS